MRIRLLALASILLIALLALGGYWLRQRQSAARRVERWQTQRQSTDTTQLQTVVYPLPQPEPAGMNQHDWAHLIEANVEPGTWDSVGGSGHIEAVPGALVIVQRRDNHRRIRSIIDTLASLEDSPPTSNASDGESASLMNMAAAARQQILLPPRQLNSIEARILSELDKPTTGEFVETPLNEVVRFLHELHHIPIILHTEKLKEAGVSIDIPITRNFNGISLRSALRLLLRDLELTFIVRDEALIITTPEDAESHLRSIAYPVHDLVGTPEADFDSLSTLILVCVAPQSWDEGMTGGFPTVGNGWIIIQQTDDVHEQVVHLLTQLRRLLSTEDLPRVVPVPPYTIGELKIRHALNQPLHLNFRQTPLREAVFYVQQALNIPIVLNQKRLEEAGIDVDKPVTLNAPEGPARLMLELVLEPLKLTYLIREEVLQITTPEDSESQLITRIYDVRPLLATTFNYDSLPKLIEDTIEQSSWATVGGPGSTHIFQDLLIVGQTEQVHRQLEQWLDRELTKVESTGASAQGPEDRQEAAPTGRSGKSK
jgi:hypothetical protein